MQFVPLFVMCILSSRGQVGHLRDNAAFKRHLSQLQVLTELCILCLFNIQCDITCLQTGLRYVFNGVTLKNNEAMEALLQSAIELAVGMCILPYSISTLFSQCDCYCCFRAQTSSEKGVLTRTEYHVPRLVSKPLSRQPAPRPHWYNVRPPHTAMFVISTLYFQVFEENSVFASEEKLYDPFLSLLRVCALVMWMC